MKRRNFLKLTGTAATVSLISANMSAGSFFDFSLLKKSGRQLSDRLNYLQGRIAGLPPNEISMDYAVLMTESFRKTEGQSMIVRRAKALYHILDKLPISIDKGELIVGNVTETPRVGYFAPENRNWSHHKKGEPVQAKTSRYHDSMEFSYQIPREVENYWHEKEAGGKVGHFVADYEKILKKGFSGVKKDIETSRLEHLENGTLGDSRSDFYEAARITCEGAIRFAERFAELATYKASQEQDPLRKKELVEIAEVCSKCPSQPAETFYEAIQAFWFTHVLLHINSDDWSISPGRFDQYMYPYYRKDIDKGSITSEQAEELLACLWIKYNEIRVGIEIFTYQNVMIGGVGKNGKDATNDITWMCLRVQEKIAGAQPSLSMRCHENTPQELLKYATELLATGCGRPALFNDSIVIPALLNLGVPLAEARDYAVAGCEEIALPGTVYGIALAAHFNNANCLLNALKKPSGRFEKFDDIVIAYEKELKKDIREHFKGVYRGCRRKAANTPSPFASLLFDDCIEAGTDITEGGAKYNWVSLAEAGTITVSDSLYAIKKGVFEDQVFSMNELISALDNDFKGYEWIQAYCKNRIPKFGNDIDEIDRIAVDMAELNHNVVHGITMKNYMGGGHIMGAGAAFAWSLGKHTGATPDGRNARRSLSLSYGPTNGADKEGPTAMLNSISKIKWKNQPGGALSHVRLPYSGFDNKQNIDDICALISTFFEKGGMGLHFSIVDAELLRAAIKEPQKHLDIMVRVGGFTAQFALLDSYLQQEILYRTEHGI